MLARNRKTRAVPIQSLLACSESQSRFQGRLHRALRSLAGEARIAGAKDDALHAAIAGDERQRVADEVDRRIKDAYPEVRHVFLDPTKSTTGMRPDGGNGRREPV